VHYHPGIDPAAPILQRYAALQRLRRISRWFDTRWSVPGTGGRWRFGLDPLLGLVPVVGDLLTLGVSIYTMLEARRLGVPARLLWAMAGNVALDFIVGEIPIVGDLFDFAFKAHVRNLHMLERWTQRTSPPND